MAGELSACPHCGAALPYVQDAFCSECRNPLDAPPKRETVNIMQAAEEISVETPNRIPLSISRLLPLNRAGFFMIVASFLPALAICHLLGDKREATQLAIGGPLALAFDLWYRRSTSRNVLLPNSGGKFFYLPL